MYITCPSPWKTRAHILTASIAAAQPLPPLSDAQAHKLRLLTLLTLAARCSSSTQLTYSNLQQALSLSTSLDLEHLVTDAIYANLLTGTLNPAQQTVVVNSVAPLRDLAPGSVDTMMAELRAWSQRCESVLQDLEAEIARVKKDAAKRAQRDSETAAQIERAEKAAESASGPLRGDGGAGTRSGQRLGGPRSGSRQDSNDGIGGDAMDIDSGGRAGGTAGSKRSRGGGWGMRKR